MIAIVVVGLGAALLWRVHDEVRRLLARMAETRAQVEEAAAQQQALADTQTRILNEVQEMRR